MGTLGDRIGRRRLLLLGAAAFGGASVLGAFSVSAGMLIASRALLGVAGATLAPSTLALLRDMFRAPRQRTVAVGVWAASFSFGAAIGPLVGGVLLERFWWGSVFLVGVPVMLLLLALGPVLLPESRDPAAGRLDLPSAALSLGAVLAAIAGLKQLAQDGPGWAPLASGAAGLALGAAFVRRQRVLADPLVDLRLFRAPAFSAALATNLLALFAAFGASFFVAQYLQLVLGLSPLAAGLWTVPSSVGLIAGSLLAPVLARRARPAFAIAGGLALAAAGFGLLTRVDGPAGLAPLVAGSVVFSLGVAPAVTLSTDLIVGTAPPEHAGAAAALSETGSELGGALGIAVLGSIGAAVYRTTMAGVVPDGVPPAAAAAARGTLGGAAAAAGQLPGPLGAELLGAARAAFVQSLDVTAAVCAAVATGTAVVAAVALRRVGAGSAPPAGPARPPPEPAWPVGFWKRHEGGRHDDGEAGPEPEPRGPERSRPRRLPRQPAAGRRDRPPGWRHPARP
jgi:DHA2 family multidrug resistance protein-like MFS transporter